MDWMRRTNKRELLCGLLLMVMGIGTTAESLKYNVGELARMGPGYFPLALGVILTFIGAVIMVSPSAGEETESIVFSREQIRTWILIVLGLVVFIVLGHYAGFVLATFALIFISALGDRANSIRAAAQLGVGVTLAAIVIFHYGLQMQFPLFWWS